MAKLGSPQRPAVARVRNQSRAEEILSLCNERGWKVILGVEPDEPEDVSAIEKLLNPALTIPVVSAAEAKVGRNEPCHCGSGRKFKRCCGAP